MKLFRRINKKYGFPLIVLLSTILWITSIGLYENRNSDSHEKLLELEVIRVEAYYEKQVMLIVRDMELFEAYVKSNSELMTQETFENYIEVQHLNKEEYDVLTIALFSDNDTKLIHEYVYPLEVDSIVLGYDILNDDRTDIHNIILESVETNNLVYNGPYLLRQGYQGITFRKAIYIDGELFGMINIVADYEFFNTRLEENVSTIVQTSIYDSSKNVVFGDMVYSESFDYYNNIGNSSLDWYIGLNEIDSFHNKYIYSNVLIIFLSIILYAAALSIGIKYYRNNKHLLDVQEKLINFDSLTKLPNRRRLKETISELIEEQNPFFLGFGDLDNFKNLNDILGHSIGDIYLKDVADRFRSISTNNLIIYRWGGDEFIFVIKEIVKEEAIAILEKIYSIFIHPVTINQTTYKVSMSVGVVNYPAHGNTLDDLIKKADIVMYDVKANQKNQYAFFEDKYLDKLLREVDFENKLNEYTLDNFKVYLQSIVDVKTNKIVGFEALSRLFDESGNIVNTGEVIKYYERNGKIQALDYQMFETVCAYSNEIKEKVGMDLFYTFNMSPLSLSSETIEHFRGVTKKYNINPSQFVIEIIETIGFKDINESIILLNELRDIGFQIAMDDFGMGYSSLSYITKLPLSIIKIDKTFIDNYAINEFDKLLIYTINDISRSLDLKIIVEGVETQEQLDFIKGISCHYYQGYLFSKVVSLEETIILLEKEKSNN